MKKIAFLSGTRADFGKLKSLISSLAGTPEEFQVEIYVTGMHMNPDYGNTHLEVESAFKHLKVHLFNNHDEADSMDIVLAKTIMGLSGILKRSKPDLLVVHGDRVEALAGAIVASLNNTLVAHIEGGEVSGTIDELMRHAITKMSHLHFVSNASAFQNVLQLGEDQESIHVIGSPDIDVMNGPGLPSLAEVTSHYGIPFENYAILLYHPVTTNLISVEQEVKKLCEYVRVSGQNFVLIGPNNDSGSDLIVDELNELLDLPTVKFFPSIRFEYFLVLLKHADFILGNSSAGIREAPHFGTPSLNVGLRQHKRGSGPLIFDIPDVSLETIMSAAEKAKVAERTIWSIFGDGNSHTKFLQIMRDELTWETDIQKLFVARELSAGD